MKLIDISHILDENTPVFPGDFQTRLSQHRSLDKDNYNSALLQSCLHTGTHVDMPMHLTRDGRMASDFTPDCFAGKGVLLDVRGEQCIGMKPAYRDLIEPGDIVLLLTGTDEEYYSDSYFSAHPSLCGELVEFFIERRVKMLGLDMPSPDHSPFALHRRLLENDIFILENLTNLRSLIGVPRFDVIALPLKIAAEASFVRAVCAVYD